ncbi:MAG: fused MFS/spermidine synthase [Rhodospirillales bacterium]|nr:fused MFS/spermidine synthase [Rhodospirillales bacterium]
MPPTTDRTRAIHAAVILFLAALLMFWAEPLAARLVLPFLGGSPMVWTTAMVFFQAALLAGYLGAHLMAGAGGTSGAGFGLRAILPVLILVGLGALVLPIGVPSFYPLPPADRWPVPWLAGFLGVAVGAPFVALAVVAPLVQSWLARAPRQGRAIDSPPGTAGDGNVYRLYVASNAGSFAALLAYPFVVEPLFDLAAQSRLWAGSYLILFALLAALALALARGSAPPGMVSVLPPTVRPLTGGTAPPSWKDRAGWLFFALVPASLLFGVTLHLTTDVASVPFLWVIPLALYLLSFVVAFSRRGEGWHPSLVKLQVPLLVLLALVFSAAAPRAWPLFVLHLIVFFVTATVCHGELFRRRPPAPRLTEFYLWLALGGMLGGMFNAVLAPVMFDRVVEYPLALAAAPLLRPKPRPDAPLVRWADIPLPVAAVAAFAGAMGIATVPGEKYLKSLAVLAGLAFAGALIYACRHRPSRLALALALVLAAGMLAPDGRTTLATARTFFGVHRVTAETEANIRLLFHGTTVHGAQYADAKRRRIPLGYYHPEGPLGQFFAARADFAPPLAAALIGLGAGAAACYRRPGDSWTFYEIDPAVEQLARRYFAYLADCAPEAKVVIGDGRLALARARENIFGLIVIDAFSSDAVPVHLLTREAMAGYLDKLGETGVILFHLSNRHLDLAPVAAALARDLGLAGRVQNFNPPGLGKDAPVHEVSSSVWVALARSESALGASAADPRWAPLVAKANARPWTDGFSNLAQAIRW